MQSNLQKLPIPITKGMDEHLFIVVEGIDGTGKSSVSKELAKRLDAKYFDAHQNL